MINSLEAFIFGYLVFFLVCNNEIWQDSSKLCMMNGIDIRMDLHSIVIVRSHCRNLNENRKGYAAYLCCMADSFLREIITVITNFYANTRLMKVLPNMIDSC